MSSHRRTVRLALTLLAAGTVALTSCRRAAEITQEPIVSTEWVAEHLGRDELVLIQVGPPEEYPAGHLPGARYLDFEMISTSSDEGLQLEMPPVAQLEETFEALGVSDDSRIVVYFASNWIAPAARVFLTLDYLGLGSRTSVMDGGLNAWTAEGGRVTSEVPLVERGDLTPQPRTDVLATIDWLIAYRDDPSVALLDARPDGYYFGTRSRAGMRAGHIPGAQSLPAALLLEPTTLRLKDRETLSQMFLAVGADAGDRVVSYCFTGGAASVVYLAARHLGYEASLYDGSFQEWSGNADLPVEVAEGVAE
ncbi:MAG: hypothetical protein AMS25_09785 [Gemmatimonas sp. SM23_52]|nr:MAG: hypothetical protein AMS25_09785 [Gemmatimonas sp. SM23_52]